MNTDTDRSSESVWMFLHGELEASRRAAWEREMAADPELRRSVERAGRVDRMLRALLRETDESAAAGEDLDSRAQAAWEREQACAAPAVARPAPAKRTGWLKMAPPAAVGFVGLAAAAVLVLAFNPAVWERPGARWQEPEFSPIALRGAGDVSGRSTVDARAAGRCQAALREAVEACAAERGVTLPSGLTFSFRMQALRDGAFSVAVQARTRDGRTAGEWFGDYSGVDAFLGHVNASAIRMVQAVASPPGEAGGGRP